MINNIELRNFKSLKHANLELSNVNLLVGLNGVGKSSLIQSFILLHQSFLSGNLEEELQLNSEKYINIGCIKDALNEERNGEYISYFLKFDNNKTLDLMYEFDKNEYNFESESIKLSKEYSHICDSYERLSLFDVEKFEYLNSERIALRNIHQISSHLVDNCNCLGKNGEYSVHFLSNSIKNNDTVSIESLIHPNSIRYENNDIESINPINNNNFFTNVVNWISEISPGINLSPKVLSDIGIATMSISYTGKDNITTNEYKSTNVGFGITYILPVVIALLKSKPDDLIIIENPESHVHPNGQFRIGRLIALAGLAGVQLIIETHSDHIIDGIKSCNSDDLIKIFHFEKETSTHQLKVNSIDNLVNLDSLFSDYFYSERRIKLNKTLAKYKKPLIIVEGKTDEEILRIAWSKLYPNIEIPFRLIFSGIRIDNSGDSGGADSVRREIEYLSMILDENKAIGLFDNDEAGCGAFKGLSRKVFSTYDPNLIQRKHLTKDIFGLILPIPSFRIHYKRNKIKEKFFCIEHYFTDDILEANNLKGDSILGTKLFYIIDANKNKFKDSLRDLEPVCFQNFELLFQELLNVLDIKIKR